MKINQVLGLSTVVLLVLSGWTYYNSISRAERFERGQKFLQQLNPDEIVEIHVVKGEDEVELRRQGEQFVLESSNGYPATNEAVNRFVRDVMEISLEKEVGRGGDLEEELGLTADTEDAVEVVFNAESGEMVRFVVGKGADDASGNYVVSDGVDERMIYLTDSRIFLRTAADDFLKKEILDVKGDEIAAIQGADFRIVHEEEEDGWKLDDLPSGKKETSKVDQAKHILSSLRFTKHYLADAAEVRGLRFTTRVRVDLTDESFYEVLVGEQGDKHYLQVIGGHQAQQVSIAVDAGDEEVQKTAETLERLTEIDDFNAFHGSWIYEVSEGTANKIRLAKSDLYEDA